MITGKQYESDFQKDLVDNFLSVHNSFGTLYDLYKIKLMVNTLDETINNVINTVNIDLAKEDFDVARSMSNQPDIHFIRTEFKDIFRKSLFVSSFSFFENGLSGIIETLKAYKSIVVENDKIEGYGKALQKEKLIDNSSALWDTIVAIGRIRNFITHKNAKVPSTESYDKLRKDFQKNKYPGLVLHGNQLEINDNTFLDFCIDRFEELLNQIYINSKYIK